MKTLIEILLCIALVGVELLAVALLVAPRAVWRAISRTARGAAMRVAITGEAVWESVRQWLQRGGPWLRPPRPA